MKTIYVIDDDKVTRLKIKDMINSFEKDYKVELFTSGNEILAKILEEVPDAIISDIEMPEINGLDLCRKIKSLIDTYIPIILITGKKLTKREVLEGYESGCDDYITKPFDSYELYTRLKPVLKIKELQTRLLEKNRVLEEVVKNRTKELYMSRENYMSIFNSTTSGVLPVSSEGVILDCNDTVSELLYKDKVSIIGKKFNNLFKQVNVHWLNKDIFNNLRKTTIIYEVISENKRISYVSLIIKLFKYNDDLTYLFILDDITNIIKAYNQLQKITFNILKLLTQTIEAKDKYTKGHSIRVAALSVQFAKELNLSDEEVYRIKLGSLLHDIGKIGIPESILNKKGKLTESEYKEIKKHPSIGVNILKNIDYFTDIIPIVKGHHEKLDGTGYPGALSDKSISIEERIVAIADIWDALTSNRSYRDPISTEEALRILDSMKLSELDKDLVDFFSKNKIYKILDNSAIEEDLYI